MAKGGNVDALRRAGIPIYTKTDLFTAATTNYEKLNSLILGLTEKRTESHYAWAMKKLKAHRKNCANM